LAEDHRTILLSILATALAGSTLLVLTIAISGKIDLLLIQGYVLPLFISAFTLSVYWIILFARHKGRFGFLGPLDPAKEEKPAPATATSA
jgi:hypothetical protein